jgi:NDP-sugar pyrophosphorylase family protein
MPDAIILCGGAGVRLKSVTGDGPKAMARIAGRPFLELLLRQLQRSCVRRVILAVGYRKENIASYFGSAAFGLDLIYSDEPYPLGTGGALRNAASLLQSDAALVLNGDSYTDADLCQLVAINYEAQADASVVVVQEHARVDCGSVVIDSNTWITEFREKCSSNHSIYVNAGIYALSNKLLLSIPGDTQISLEHDLFPRWLNDGKAIRAFVSTCPCIDIGTPERYQYAQAKLAGVELHGTAATHAEVVAGSGK